MNQTIGAVKSLLPSNFTAVSRLKRQIDQNILNGFLAGLNRKTTEIPSGFLKQLRRLLENMQEVAESEEFIMSATPILQL